MGKTPRSGAWAVRFEDRPQYEPRGHAGVVNRSLVGPDVDDAHRLSVWHGTMATGGEADPHVHVDSDQVYVVLAGGVEVGCADEVREIARLDATYMPAGVEHWIKNHGSTPAEVLVISTPPLPGNSGR